MLGIHITDEAVYVADVRGNAKRGSIKTHVTEKLPKGAVERGVIADEEIVSEVLTKAVESFGKKKTAALCLSSQMVYARSLNVAASHGKRFRRLLTTALEDEIPEENTAMQYKAEILGKNNKQLDVAVVCISNVVLESYVRVCTSAGVKIISITSPSLGYFGMHPKKDVSIGTIIDVDNHTNTCVMSRGWCKDEVLSSNKATAGSVADTMLELAKEYGENDAKIYLLGPKKVVSDVEKKLKPEKKTKKRKPKSKKKGSEEDKDNENSGILEPEYTVEIVKTPLSEKEYAYLGACIACWSAGTHMNVIAKERRISGLLWGVVVLLLICGAGVGISMVRPDLVPPALVEWVLSFV